MDPFKRKVEDELGVKLLSVMYLGRRQLNLRTDEKVMTPEDMAGVTLRMPGTSAWQFLGRALGASPTPMAFSEVYTALQTGAIGGQDNPLPTVVYSKFYEVTSQIILTYRRLELHCDVQVQLGRSDRRTTASRTDGGRRGCNVRSPEAIGTRVVADRVPGGPATDSTQSSASICRGPAV